MKILSVAHALPSRRLTNAEVLGHLRDANRAHFSDDQLELLDTQARKGLESAGTSVRYALADGEHALEFGLDAACHSLAAADVEPEEVDFVVYGGVGRAFIEPAMANVVQAELGLVNATGFDIIDGCASWLRGLQIARAFFAAGTYRRGLIVNCECGFGRYIDHRLERPEDLAHHFATLTVSEVATATVVGNENPGDDFHFNIKNFGEHYDLCVLPIDDGRDFFSRPRPRDYVPMKLYSQSRALLTTAAQKIVETYRSDPVLRERPYDICFGHAASKHAEEGVLDALCIPLERYFGTHAEYGNTVSASVPLGMSLALDAGRLRRGDRVLILVAAAGIVVGLTAFTY
jgi:3-oxoacyl-[acyl-carrier-protein] synthase III